MKIYDSERYADQLTNLELSQPLHVMEVCGTHTTQFFHTGVKDIFPANLKLIDGPGCPVCVTPNEYLDRAVAIAWKYGTTICTFGDMMRVPSSSGSLQSEKARGLDVRIVYSPIDALSIAETNPDREVVFLSVGFETTMPTEAVAVQQAYERGIANFSMLCGNKLTPPAVRALLESGEVNIDGFILPGHVSIITGIKGWRFIVDEFRKPCVIAGFESHDLLAATLMLVRLIQQQQPDMLNEYTQAVTEAGNITAQKVVAEVFTSQAAKWRGIGVIPGSGMKIHDRYEAYDAEKKFPVSPAPSVEPVGCRCGEVLRGLITPPDCPLFDRACTPENPVGACMVSSEGSCAAYYKYQRR